MRLLADDQIDQVIRNRRRLFFGGLGWFVLLLVVPVPKEFKIGFFTSFAILGYGEYAFVLQKWKTDPGLWMLATFLAVSHGPIVGYFEYLELAPLMNLAGAGVVGPKGWDEFRLACDCALTLIVFSKFVRFAFSVAVRNWQLTHPPRSTDHPPNETNYLD